MRTSGRARAWPPRRTDHRDPRGNTRELIGPTDAPSIFTEGGEDAFMAPRSATLARHPGGPSPTI